MMGYLNVELGDGKDYYSINLDTNPELFEAVLGIISIREDDGEYKFSKGNYLSNGEKIVHKIAEFKENDKFHTYRLEFQGEFDPYLYPEGDSKQYVEKNYKLATPEEIIAHFSKKDNKTEKMEEFTFDKNNWCVKNTEESLPYIKKYMLDKFDYIAGGGYIYYGSTGRIGFENNIFNKSWGTELTLEQFKEHILNEKPVEAKKIIGYNLTKTQYSDAALKICGINSFSKNGVDIISSSSTNQLREAGVLDLWFVPVYNSKFKIGDIIWAQNEAGLGNKGENGLLEKGEFVEIVDPSFSSSASGLLLTQNWDFIVKLKEDRGHRRINAETANARLATSEEISKLKEVCVNVSGNDVRITKGSIIAEGKKINPVDLRQLIGNFEQLEGWDVTLKDATYKIGCWENCKLSELQKVVKEYEGLQ